LYLFDLSLFDKIPIRHEGEGGREKKRKAYIFPISSKSGPEDAPPGPKPK